MSIPSASATQEPTRRAIVLGPIRLGTFLNDPQPQGHPNQEVQIIGNTIINNPTNAGGTTYGIRVGDGSTITSF